MRRRTRRSRRIIKIIFNIAAVAAATLALTVATANTASAASDTPDNEWVYGGWWATVMWNDYDNEYHDNDLDNVWVEDAWGDGYSVELTVYYDGEQVASTHAYHGDEARVSFGNVSNGDSVYWKSCLWDDGSPVTHDNGHPVCNTGHFYE